MKHWFKLIIASVLVLTVLAGMAPSIQAKQHPTGHTEKANIVLTEKQQSELDVISKEILEKRKEMISKYVEFEVIEAEKAKKMVEHLEKHYKKLQENGFIPLWDKSKR